MIIALHWKEWLDDLRVERFADAANAEAYTESLPTDRTAFVIETDKLGWGEHLFVWKQQYTMRQLAQIAAAVGRYQLPPKFRSADAGARHLEDLILDEARDKELTIFNPAPTFVDRDAHEREMLANADAFYACAFRGYPKGHDTVVCKTLDEAKKVAADMYDDRPVMIYAVRCGRQTHLENYDPTGAVMPKDVKLGEFKKVPADTMFGKIVKAHLDADGDLTVAQTAVATGLDEMQVISHLRGGRGNHGIDHKIDKESKVVTILLPEGVHTSEVLKPAESKSTTAKEPKEPRVYKVGEFRPVRRDSGLGKLVTAAKPGDIVALDDMAAELGINSDAVVADLKSLRRSHGFEFTVTDGMVELKVPEGKEPYIAAPAPRAASGTTTPGMPKEGTKKERLLAMASRPEGATMAEMLELTGWKSCRGTLGEVAAAAGKVVTHAKGDDGVSIYRLVPAQTSSASADEDARHAVDPEVELEEEAAE